MLGPLSDDKEIRVTVKASTKSHWAGKTGRLKAEAEGHVLVEFEEPRFRASLKFRRDEIEEVS